MKNVFILCLIILITAISISCSSVEDAVVMQPCISKLEDTGCLSHLEASNVGSRSGISNNTFEMIFEGSTAKCKFSSLDYPCDYYLVNVKIHYDNDILSIVEYPSSDTADCRCEISASFTIDNFPQNDFILKIYHAGADGNYSISNPNFEGQVNQTDGRIVITY